MFLKSIYYTNEAVDLPIYASLKVGNGICSEQSEISLGYKSFILDKKQNGCVTLMELFMIITIDFWIKVLH